MSRMLLAAALSAVAFMGQTGAGTHRIVGVIKDVDHADFPTIELASKGAKEVAIRTDAHTTYERWVTHKPWQADRTAGREGLIAGRCVAVELRSGERIVAKDVRISGEPAGSLFDPCKSER